LIKKKLPNSTTIEQFIADAEAKWMRAWEDANNGNINPQQISVAMDHLNNAHKQAIKENKRYLIS
jgi:hypothetical protein